MPDIDPAALSRPSISSSTPILPPKSLTSMATSVQKPSKACAVPARIDLEPLYSALRVAVGDNWATYKEAVCRYVLGQLNQTELSSQVDWFLVSFTGETEHLHNQLLAAIYANVTREMPDQGVAPWVSSNDKPSTTGSKPVNGDAAEQRLKAEVMQLPSRDRRRLKDLVHNEIGAQDTYVALLGEHHGTKSSKAVPDLVPRSAGGLTSLHKTNWDLEIRKRFAQPLAVESGEFPDASSIDLRMLPICYDNGLYDGNDTGTAQFMSAATETFVKQFLSSVCDKTRSNGPGSNGPAGGGGGGDWVQTRKYRRQLEQEEAACLRGEVARDKNGLLPVEAKAASDRDALGIADLRIALELGDCGIGQMPIALESIMLAYREGELENWDQYYMPSLGCMLLGQIIDKDVIMGNTATPQTNGLAGQQACHVEEKMDEAAEWGWLGASSGDREALNSLLESCLAV